MDLQTRIYRIISNVNTVDIGSFFYEYGKIRMGDVVFKWIGTIFMAITFFTEYYVKNVIKICKILHNQCMKKTSQKIQNTIKYAYQHFLSLGV